MTPAQAAKKKLSEQPNPLAALADELGALEKEYALALAPLEKKIPRIKQLERSAAGRVPGAGRQRLDR